MIETVTVVNPTGSLNVTYFQKSIKNIVVYWRPVFASIVVALGSMIPGSTLSYPSPAIPNINAHPNPFRVDPEQQSWFVSLCFLASLSGAIVSGLVMDKLGRKLSMMLSAFPCIVGWTIIAGASDVIYMDIGRAITGFCTGFNLCVIEVYISEISPPEIRGHLMSFNELNINVSILFVHVVGTYIPWNWLAIVCASIPCLQAILLLLVPESPRWLLMRGQTEATVASLNWLRGEDQTTNHEKEIAVIRNSFKQASQSVPWLDYLRPPHLKSICVSQFLFILQELSGFNIIRVYTVTIFQESGSTLDANSQTIIISVIFIVGSCIFTGIVDFIGRRTLVLTSVIVVGISMANMGAFFQIKEIDEIFAQEYLSWLPLLSMVVATVSFTLGIGPMPYVITSELFSTSARGRANSLGVATLSVFGFLTTKFFADVTIAVGQACAFWFCAVVCVLGTIVAYFIMPETKGKMLETIQQNLGQ